MESVLLFLTSGLFLGWSLGANDAANVFGTAVGSRMIRFATAASICSLFVVLGAVFGGAGAAHGLGKLGQVDALAGSFTVALAAALTVHGMTRAGLPVSTTQAIVGGIVGWNVFSGSPTDVHELTRIIGTWVICPILGALFAALIYLAMVRLIRWRQPHLLRRDWYTRWGLILAGAFGSYSLGANNIGNVMGVFVSSSPFHDIRLAQWLTVTSTQQLFLLGAIAIAVGVFTYSRGVMMTVGRGLMPLNPVAAWVVVVAHAMVLYLFSSTWLQGLSGRIGVQLPLIPVSSSQAVVGAVIGVAAVQSGGKALRQVRWKVLLNIASGWVSTPLVAALLSLALLYIVQNVFQETVYDTREQRRANRSNVHAGAALVGPARGTVHEAGSRFSTGKTGPSCTNSEGRTHRFITIARPLATGQPIATQHRGLPLSAPIDRTRHGVAVRRQKPTR